MAGDRIYRQLAFDTMNDANANDNDHLSSENEDDLERQLAALQHKLALKKQKAAARASSQSGSPAGSPVKQRPQSEQEPQPQPPRTPERRPRSASTAASASPFKTPPRPSASPYTSQTLPPQPTTPTSPARVLLGIDKGLSGWDVSLKRPKRGEQTSPFASPNGKAVSTVESSPRRIVPSIEKYVARSPGRTRVAKPPISTGPGAGGRKKVDSQVMSFAERMKRTKADFDSHAQTVQRMRDQRRAGFGIPTNVGHDNNDDNDENNKDKRTKGMTRDQPLSRATTDALAKSHTADTDIHEPFTNLRLAHEPKIPFATLQTQFDDAEVFNLSRLYATVSPPEFDPPQVCNWVLIAVVAKKSKVFDRPADASGSGGRVSKYVMLTLCDLGTFEVSLAISGPAFDKYWKLGVGQVVALLNPGIYKTRQKRLFDSATGPTTTEGEGGYTFGLFVNDAQFDSVLELGRSRDLGKCAATTAKGHPCSHWVNARKATYCDFHAEAKVRKARSGRMEMNSVAQGQPMGRYGAGSSKTVLMKYGNNNQPDFANKEGLLDDPLKPAPKYSAVYGKVWTSVSGSAFQHADNSGTPNSAFDSAFNGLRPTPLNAQAVKARAEKQAKERQIREALAKRPDGIQLRYYDQKGNPLESQQQQQMTQEQPAQQQRKPAFRPEHIRRIGFNPTVSSVSTQPPGGSQAAAGQAERDAQQAALTASLLSKRALGPNGQIDLSMNKRKYKHPAKVTKQPAGPATTGKGMSPQKMKQVLANMKPIGGAGGTEGDGDDSDDLEIV